MHKTINLYSACLAIGLILSLTVMGASAPSVKCSPSVANSLQQSMIWASETPPGNGAYFVAFRRQFVLQNRPRQATLHLFADVRYMLWVNGEYVTRGPARFNPRGPEYDTILVGSHLKPGLNTFAVLVMAHGSNSKMMRHAPCLTVNLFADSRAVLTTDAAWKWNDHTRYAPPYISWANVNDRIDARLEDGDWTLPDYDDAHWKTAVHVDGVQWGLLTQRRIPLLRETPLPVTLGTGQTLPVTLTAGQEISFDTGRLAQAYTALDIDADAGSILTLPYARVTYTARAGRQAYLTSDTCAFQAGTLHVESGRVTVYKIQPVERVYPFDCVGSFRSSDPVLDRIWTMCARSVQICSEDAYVDCADRERAEWMDNDRPAFSITRTALAGPGKDGGRLYADPRLLEELLRRTALTQQPAGWVKAHTSSDRFDIHAYMEDRACDWVEGARRYYESTGNKPPIREIWPAITTQMNWFLNHRTSRGLVLAREWEVWGNPMGYQVCEGAGLNAFIYKALVDAAYLGRVIGEQSQAAKFDTAAKSLAAAFNSVLWDEADGTYYSAVYGAGETPHAEPSTRILKLKIENALVEPTLFPALFALDQGIVPQARRARVTRYLLAQRANARTVMTFYYLFRQLYADPDGRFDQEVINLIHTNWQPMADTRWKTSWENMQAGSYAHIYGAFPGYYLSAFVLGVRPDGPVWNHHLLIEPHLGNLASAEGAVVTEFGAVPVNWKRMARGTSFQVTIPKKVTAVVSLPRTGMLMRVTVDGKKVPTRNVGSRAAFTLGSGAHSCFVAASGDGVSQRMSR